MKTNVLAVTIITALLAAPLANAKQPDTARATAVPPTIDASEDTIVTYPGGPPPASVSGALDADDSTYNRVFNNCATLSGIGTNVRYDTITFTNTSAGTATVNATMTCAGDGFLTAYTGTFNPAAPLANCLTSDDDTNGACPALTGVSVPAGQTVVFVVSEYDDGDMGTWALDFGGTTPVTLQAFKVE